MTLHYLNSNGIELLLKAACMVSACRQVLGCKLLVFSLPPTAMTVWVAEYAATPVRRLNSLSIAISRPLPHVML